MRAAVFLLLIIDLDAAAANTVTSAKVLEGFAFIFIRSRELSRETLSWILPSVTTGHPTLQNNFVANATTRRTRETCILSQSGVL